MFFIRLQQTLNISFVMTVVVFILLLTRHATADAAMRSLTDVHVASQSSDQLQIQLSFSDAVASPSVFKTDNPARIVLDFADTTNGLNKKIYPINQSSVLSAYVIEANNRIRVIINLLQSVPYRINVQENKVLLTLTDSNMSINFSPKASEKTLPIKRPELANTQNNAIETYLPKQSINNFDFKRGDKNEGRLLVSLANPNTIVNSKKEHGKVIIHFLNTQLPDTLAKRLDVSEFATPVKYIDTVFSKQGTTLTVTTVNESYDYSVLQTNGLITIEFRPLSEEEKEQELKSRVKYTGDRLSLNFQDIEIRSVIAILAEFTGQNIVAGEDVSGNITLKLDDIPWDEALDFIMMTKDLGKYQSGNVTLISPLDKIKDYKEKQQKMEEVVEKSDALITEYIKINYAKAESFKSLLNGMDTGAFGSCGASNELSTTALSGSIGGSTVPNDDQSLNASSRSILSNTAHVYRNALTNHENLNTLGSKPEDNRLLSSRGSAIVDSRTNMLIVKDTAKKLDDVRNLIHKLDVPVQQVMIESRIVIADDTFAKTLGVKFGAGKQGAVGDENGDIINYAVGGKGTASTNGVTALNNSLVDLGADAIGATPVGALGMTLAKGADYVLNLEVQALQSDGRGESISNPRVMTMNRCTAHIIQGVQVPYVTLPTTVAAGTSQSNTVPTVTFRDATLALNVTPQITPSGAVLMNLVIKKDNVNEAASVGLNGNKVLDKREIQTSVLVEDGETIVLGGVYEDNDSLTKNKIPFFAELPVLGDLFTNRSTKNTKKELLIFVTPKIVKDSVPIASDMR
jgi:type IV pilus assembly protein PilQ